MYKLLARRLNEDWVEVASNLTRDEAILSIELNCGYYAEHEFEKTIASSSYVNGVSIEYKAIEM